MVNAALLGDGVIWMTYATITLVAVILLGKLWLFQRARQSRFGGLLLLFSLMLSLFLIAEIIHLWDMLRAPAQAELFYTLITLGGFIVFAALMRSLEAFSRTVGFAQSDFMMARRLERSLCTICGDVRLKTPFRALVERKMVSAEGLLMPGVTLETLVKQGLVEHPPHRRKRGA